MASALLFLSLSVGSTLSSNLPEHCSAEAHPPSSIWVPDSFDNLMQVHKQTVAKADVPRSKIPHAALDPHSHCTLYQLHPSASEHVPNCRATDVMQASDLELHQMPLDRPVLIRGGAADLFRKTGANSMWTIEGLLQKPAQRFQVLGSHGVGIANLPDEYLQDLPGVPAPSKRILTINEALKEEHQTVIWAAMETNELVSNETLRKDHQDTSPLEAEYFRTLNPGSMFLRQNTDFKVCTFVLHISNQGGALPHFHEPVVNSLFQGAKRWILYNFEHCQDAGCQQSSDMLQVVESRWVEAGYTSHDWFKEHAEDLAGYHEHVFDFIQQEGDALFIPEGWFHATIDLCRETLGAVLMGGDCPTDPQEQS
eukprot:gnl/TRDRNA2_/TRDRNA2_156320_c2_seq12.p1 gnl/TRDRNA2_/TRDRNA2_156320_c2~~gnl/TRDRNA2_/TRDRNA2_156320_c2_seq12.p1  ORF type:complete len:367 (+),score=40.57 gnl/TRDRNA2_/TRDRNA2_156320_c2_seq12:69-1169(+)